MGTVTILMYFLGCLNPEDVQAMATSWHLEIRKGEVSCDISPTIMVIYPSVTSTAPPSRCSFCKCSDCLGSSFGFMTCRITWSLALSSQSDFVSPWCWDMWFTAQLGLLGIDMYWPICPFGFQASEGSTYLKVPNLYESSGRQGLPRWDQGIPSPRLSQALLMNLLGQPGATEKYNFGLQHCISYPSLIPSHIICIYRYIYIGIYIYRCIYINVEFIYIYIQ